MLNHCNFFPNILLLISISNCSKDFRQVNEVKPSSKIDALKKYV